MLCLSLINNIYCFVTIAHVSSSDFDLMHTHHVPAIIWGGKQYHTGGESFYGGFRICWRKR